MDGIATHIPIPAVTPAAIVGLYFTPVTLIGCVNCGLLARAVVLVSLLAGIAAGVVGIKARQRDPDSRWRWIATLLILATPALLVLGPFGLMPKSGGIRFELLRLS